MTWYAVLSSNAEEPFPVARVEDQSAAGLKQKNPAGGSSIVRVA
jgi:hypothetical protein